MKILKQKYLYFSLMAICTVSFLAMSWTLYSHVIYKNTVIQTTRTRVQSEIDRIATEVNTHLDTVALSVQTAAGDFSAGKITEKDLEKELTKIAEGNKHIIKFNIIFSDSQGQPNATYPSVCSGPQGLKKDPWCDRGVARGAGWDEPVFDDAVKYYTSTLAIPLSVPASDTKTTAKTSGTIYIDISLFWLKEKMDSENLKKNISGIILSKKGYILYHPINDMVLNQSNIFDTLAINKEKNKNYDEQRQIMQNAVNGQSGSGLHMARTGESYWYFYEPIRKTGWALVVNFTKDTISLNGKNLRKQEILIALLLITFFTSLAALLLRLHDLQGSKKRQLWTVVIIFSLLSFITACFTWYLALAIPLKEYQQNKIVIDDPMSMNRFMDSSDKLSKDLYGKEPVFIPTGIYIQSLDFSSSNDITISGYIWQRYLKTSQVNIPRGFILPESKTMTITEAYRQNDSREEVIGWYFEATVRQSLDYSKYPFDHPNISLWLRHKDFMHNVILVPDLKGYRSLNANSLPGLQPQITLPGYTFSGTFFSEEPRIFNANFGVTVNAEQRRTTEFFYNIIIGRNFITPLVSKFFPILIVISMLFIVILSFSTDAVKQKNFGLSGMAIFGLIISFFFTTLLTQIDLRQQFKADSIIFIENFNFITYFILLLSTAQAFLFSAEKKIKFIQYEHCLIPKLLYWPIFTSLILAASLVYFF